ncbi:Aste57867_15486 [Aphanomyces stellatus]|uniref:Aste57867_15486 protein n=1 Tax=Aphanomyces stellatus TaxID=120398 RepID=A0A485L543_9STRA|nr:hypothetical protein As57867_015430 [Aphanomyces stellatus]VFT92288.1 Aste57867_15486 [Aphanomyces stellatus]
MISPHADMWVWSLPFTKVSLDTFMKGSSIPYPAHSANTTRANDDPSSVVSCGDMKMEHEAPFPKDRARIAVIRRHWMIVPRRYAYWSGLICFFLGFMCSTAWNARSTVSLRNYIHMTALSLHHPPPPTVLVTGGLGFIGSHVVEDLTQHGFHVVVMDDMSNGRNFDVARNASAVLLKDITHLNDFSAISTRIDYVVHLAAAISVVESISQPDKYHHVNVDGSRHVLEWAKRHKVKRVVAASTSSIYGDVSAELMPLKEESATGGISPYATTKFDMEHLMEAYSANGLPTTALRIFNVYGPRQDPSSPHSGVVSYFMDQAFLGTDGRLEITGDGEQYRDFIYVKDVAVAIRLAMLSSDPHFDAFNVCTGTKTTINALAQEILETCASGAAIEYKERRPGDVRESVCDPTKAEVKLGFAAQYSYEDGIAATWAWILDRRRRRRRE